METNSEESMNSGVAEHVPPYFEPKKTNETPCCYLFPLQVQNFYTNALALHSETSQYSLAILPIMKLILILIQTYLIL